MTLSSIITAIEKIAPPELAESWDNVGLLAGDPNQEISRILLTIDYSPAVAEEARKGKSDLVIAYHPPIFETIKRIVAPSPVYDAIRRGIAIYSPHTALDAADGGTNDVLADILEMTDRWPLKTTEGKSTHYKLVVFVPIEAVEKVSSAMFNAGAGRIGNYTSCSFRAAGTGTFFGESGTSPAVGQSGRLEKVDEIRLETLVPVGAVDAVIAALRSSHPYEEPAFDLVVLSAAPTSAGAGKIGSIPPTSREAIFKRIKRGLGLQHLLIAGPMEGTISTVAICAGAGGMLLDDAIAGKVELYLTGELRHHDATKAAGAGITVVCTLHSNSERAVLKRLADRLAETPGMPQITISKNDHDPFSIV
jgi:dinuclear metal center YbgI/SA1388 family protein